MKFQFWADYRSQTRNTLTGFLHDEPMSLHCTKMPTRGINICPDFSVPRYGKYMIKQRRKYPKISIFLKNARAMKVNRIFSADVDIGISDYPVL